MAVWSNYRNDSFASLTRVSPISGQRLHEVSVCSYQEYSFPPVQDPYCYRNGPGTLSPRGLTAAVIGMGLHPCPAPEVACTSEALRLLPLEGEQTVIPLTKPVGIRLVNEEGYDRVRWSPDGRQLLIDRPLAPRGRHGVFVAPLNNVNELTLVAEGSEADWSSHGRIVLVRGSNLYVGRLRGGFRRLTFRGGTEPSWSPRGRWLAFVRKGDLYAISSRGGKPRRITYRGGRSPVWSPDGKQIAFLRSRNQPGGRVTFLYAVRWRTRAPARRIGDDPLDEADQGVGVGSVVRPPPDWQVRPR
ncbi:MAG TPA: hypothetical protein VFQ12_05660 [Thermoleophilaceae bacterium]|nr:hypothetical protein [Thermoleophilaceae bacterium]